MTEVLLPPFKKKLINFCQKPITTRTKIGWWTNYQIIVEKHKGRLICHSEIEQGTELIIEIPTQSSSQLTSLSKWLVKEYSQFKISLRLNNSFSTLKSEIFGQTL